MIDPDIENAIGYWDTGSPKAAYIALMETHPELDSVGTKAMIMWLFRWAEDGFFSLQTSHTFAAALMATDSAGLRGDICLPARAVRVLIPDGLLRTEIEGVPYEPTVLYLWEEGIGAWLFMRERKNLCWVGPKRNTFQFHAPNLQELLFGKMPSFSEWTPQVLRIFLMARRLSAGALYTLQHTTNFVSREKRIGRKYGTRDGSEPPNHRVVTIGAPITVDARRQIAKWIASTSGRKSAPPSVQFVVRGHYKRQVIGEGRNGRKIIWVHPYWKGPESAPILARPYHVGAREDPK